MINQVKKDAVVNIHASGACVSAGMLILLQGERRTAGKSCRFMIHSCSSDLKYGKAFNH